MNQITRCFSLALVIAFALPSLGYAQGDAAERPSAMQLFPSETVLLLRTADASLLAERWQQTGFGQLMRDPQMAAIVESLYGSATEAYDEKVREFLQTDLDDLYRLPSGEIAFALIERKATRPAVGLIIDFGDSQDVALALLDQLKAKATENGDQVVDEPLRNDTATLVRDGKREDRVFGIVQRESVFVIASDRDILQSMLDRWDGLEPEPTPEPVEEEGKKAKQSEVPPYQSPLADNASFSAALKECLPGRDEPPQVIFFADPIGILRAARGRRTGVKVAMATFPALGVDGIKGIAGAMWLATDKWDSLARAHLLLENPRTGVLKVARLEPGDLTPPACIPTGLEIYGALHADPQRMFNEIAMLYDKFQYEGAFRKQVDKNINEKLDTDFEAKVVGNLAGQLYMMIGHEPEQTEVQGRIAFGAKVKDPKLALQFVEKMVAKDPNSPDPTTLGDVTYYSNKNVSSWDPEKKEVKRERVDDGRETLGVVGDLLIFSSTEKFFNRFVDAHNSTEPRMADSLTYRLVTGRLKRLAGGRTASMISIQDNEPQFRHFYRLATDEGNREKLEKLAENNSFFRAILTAIGDNEMPPLETILKYTSPGGTVVYDTDTGMSLISFSFKQGD